MFRTIAASVLLFFLISGCDSGQIVNSPPEIEALKGKGDESGSISIINNINDNTEIEYCAYDEVGNGNFKLISNQSRQSTFNKGRKYLTIKSYQW